MPGSRSMRCLLFHSLVCRAINTCCGGLCAERQLCFCCAAMQVTWQRNGRLHPIDLCAN